MIARDHGMNGLGGEEGGGFCKGIGWSGKGDTLDGGESVKPRENLIFLKNGEMVISVKIRNFSRSRMKRRTSPLESSSEI